MRFILVNSSNRKPLQENPKFQWRFISPKYWITWSGIGFLYLLSWLPFRVQLVLGKWLGNLLHVLLKRRRYIADKNLQLCFPNMDEKERSQLVKVNFQNTGIAMFESGIAWWWPSWRFKSKFKLIGQEHIEQPRKSGKGALVLFSHILPLEIMGRVMSEYKPYVGFYRPHNNPVIEWVQYCGRCRNQNLMISKRDVKSLLKALSDGEACVYLPDHDYGKKRSVFVPFFAVNDASTTTGTEIFASHKNAVTVPTYMQRLPGTQGYELEFLPQLSNYPDSNSRTNAVIVNNWVEQSVLKNKEQYMWVHRRFKTRPDDNAKPLY